MYQVCGAVHLRNVTRILLYHWLYRIQIYNAKRLPEAEDIAFLSNAKSSLMGINHRHKGHTMEPLWASHRNKAQAFIDRDCMKGCVDSERGLA